MNVAKIHRKLMSTESQFYFANISATKAWIFMKFYMVVNYYLVSLSLKGHVSGFVGRIPLPTLESRINRNH